MKATEIRPVRTDTKDDDFYVIGIGLPEACSERLSVAFPQCLLYDQAAVSSSRTSEICDLLGCVVIFRYIPALEGENWVRVSALFNADCVKVVGVHPAANDAIFDRVLEAEFDGVVDEHAEAITYRRAANSVQQGELWFPRGYLSRRTRQAVSSTSPAGLSSRETEILALLAGGFTNQLIADRLCVSRDTVRWHLRSIYGKLGVSDREAALRLATNKHSSKRNDKVSSRQAPFVANGTQGGVENFSLSTSSTPRR